MRSLDGQKAAMSASTIASTRRRRPGAGARERVGRPATRRDPRGGDFDRSRLQAREPRDPDSVRRRLRPDRLRLHCELGAARRQSHGVLQYEASITGKWLAMLKEIAPGLARSALVANPKVTAYDHFLRASETMAPRWRSNWCPVRSRTPPTSSVSSVRSRACQTAA